MNDSDIQSITDEEFDRAVIELATEDGMKTVARIPGVWEYLSEHYNNEAIDRALENRRNPMKGFRCNACGLEAGEAPKTVVTSVCTDCGSDNIDIGEFSLDDES